MRVISISELVNKLEDGTPVWQYYLHLKTGELLEVPEEYMTLAEETSPEESLDHYPPTERNFIEDAMEIVDNWDDYIRLPDERNLDEYRMMSDFCAMLEDERAQDKLYDALEGKGAFRRFRDTVNRCRLESQWNQYKNQSMGSYLRDWCELKGIQYVD